MKSMYYHNKVTVDEYIHLAKDVSGEKLIRKLESYLKPEAHILELGSGPGTDWKILNEKYQVTGSDISKEFLKRLKKEHPQGEFLEVDAITLDTEQSFDAIYSMKVLHHLSDEELTQSVARQSSILNPGGLICHSFWKGEGSEYFKEMFVNYHNETKLQAIFGAAFDILLLESYAEFEVGDSLLLIGRLR